MSDVPQNMVRAESLLRQLAGRWQIPLLLLAVAALGTGLWRLRPISVPPTFEEHLAEIDALQRAALYPQASEYIEQLLRSPELPREQAGVLHRRLAEVIHGHELGNSIHGTVNARRIVENTDAALAAGQPADARMCLMRALAMEWQRLPVLAVEAYRQALSLGADDPWAIRKRILEIQREEKQISHDALRAELDTFLVATDVSDALRYWAAELRVWLLAEDSLYEEAERLLAAHADRFKSSSLGAHFGYLEALVWFHLGRLDDADRQLRALRDGLVPGDPLYARTGWLLGRIYQSHEAPEPALAFFDEVIDKTTPGEYRTRSMLGRAEVLAALQRYAESLKGFEEVIRRVADQPYGSGIDLQVVRQSMTAWHETLRNTGRLPEAMAYLRLADRLVPPADERMQATYAARLADLANILGERGLATTTQPADDQIGQKAPRDWFTEAGEQYLRGARLSVLDDEASAAATWQAVDAFDRAGARQRRVEVLEAFIRQRPENVRVPEALLRLGQTYQAMGDLSQAIAAYQRNLIDFPRTYWASQSLVPLAECFVDAGDPDKAEQTLLRIVDRRSDDRLPVIEPAAQEYRDALFELADLYVHRDEYEKAIARYEEAIDRYPDDGRTMRATFLLADAYRRSAVRIREDLADPKNLAFKDELKVMHRQRLARAEQLFGFLIEHYQATPPAKDADLDRLFLKLSHFYRADAIYDQCHIGDAADFKPYLESLQKYDEAAWLYQYDPIAMSAYIQMINCHMRMGNLYEARKTLQRAGWALRNIPEENFNDYSPLESRKFWEDCLAWLERMPMFSADRNDGSVPAAQVNAGGNAR